MFSLPFSAKERCTEEPERSWRPEKRGPKTGFCLIVVRCGSQASSLPLQRSSPDLPCKDFLFKKPPLRSHPRLISPSPKREALRLREKEGSSSPGCAARQMRIQAGLLGDPPAPRVRQPSPSSRSPRGKAQPPAQLQLWETLSPWGIQKLVSGARVRLSGSCLKLK